MNTSTNIIMCVEILYSTRLERFWDAKHNIEHIISMPCAPPPLRLCLNRGSIFQTTPFPLNWLDQLQATAHHKHLARGWQGYPRKETTHHEAEALEHALNAQGSRQLFSKMPIRFGS